MTILQAFILGISLDQFYKPFIRIVELNCHVEKRILLNWIIELSLDLLCIHPLLQDSSFTIINNPSSLFLQLKKSIIRNHPALLKNQSFSWSITKMRSRRLKSITWLINNRFDYYSNQSSFEIGISRIEEVW